MKTYGRRNGKLQALLTSALHFYNDKHYFLTTLLQKQCPTTLAGWVWRDTNGLPERRGDLKNFYPQQGTLNPGDAASSKAI
jgi:hypothetical protein